MITKKLFLASSSELQEDRKDFEIFIARKNRDLVSRGVFLELIMWEDFLDAMAQTRLQDEYNKAIRECDIFVMLFFTKVGKYTEEEFENAFKQFKATNKPSIFTYFKDANISIGSVNREDVTSLLAFREKLDALGHFHTVYKNIDELKFKFDQQLDKLEAAHANIIIGVAEDQTGNQQVNAATQSQPNILEAPLSVLIDSVSQIQIPGIEHPVALETIWVQPTFIIDEGRAPLHRILSKRALAIQAPAGYGKTTIAKMIALCLAKDFLRGADSQSAWQTQYLGVRPGELSYFPLLIDLRNLQVDGDVERLFTATTPIIDSRERTALISILDAGAGVFILDGLDEIEPSRRARVFEIIQKAHLRWPECYFIITSRHFDLRSIVSGSFFISRIEMPSPELMATLLEKWSAATIERADFRARCIEDCQAFFERERSARSFISSPLVVAFLISTFKAYQKLPASKALLFARISDWLLGSRAHLRSERKIDLATAKTVITAFAFNISSGILPSIARIEDIIQKVHECTNVQSNEIEAVLRMEATGANCLIDIDGRLSFWHESLRDFFSAEWLINLQRRSPTALPPEIRTLLQQHERNEVFDFFIALTAIDGPNSIEKLLTFTAPTGESSNADIRAAATQWRILDAATRHGYNPEGSRKKAIMEAIGRILNLDEERLITMSFSDRREAAIPSGNLRLDARLYGPPLRRGLPIRQGDDRVKLGKYPITQQEYERFLKAQFSGYSPPLDWEQQKGMPNAPVRGVSWEDATNYCVWLTEEMNKSGGTIRVIARLPEKQEWCEMTGYNESSRWRDSVDRKFAVDASPVGLLPEMKGPHGHQNLCDGVWEWIGPSLYAKRRRKQVFSCEFKEGVNIPVWRRARGTLRSPVIGFRVTFTVGQRVGQEK